MSKDIMAHTVFGFPDAGTSIKFLRGLDSLRIKYIEVQIPFSDPIADGPVLMRANSEAATHTSTKTVFEALVRNKRNLKHSQVLIMCYFQTVFSYGIQNFCEQAAIAGAVGVLVPDIPFDQPEYDELAVSLAQNNLILIPVLSPNMSKKRLEQYAKLPTAMVYLTSRTGTTGKSAEQRTHDKVKKCLQAIKSVNPACQIILGFGIRGAADIQKIPKLVDHIAIGSYLTEALESGGAKATLKLVKKLLEDQEMAVRPVGRRSI